MIAPVTLVHLDPRGVAALCDGCDCLEPATHALDLHRRATAFAGQHYATRMLLCAAHLGELAAVAYAEAHSPGSVTSYEEKK